ncbi:hypothetical protein, partial [Carboxydothermus ferrireducens]
MSEERFNRLETQLDHMARMITELIRIVGNTNAAVEELRSDVNELKISNQQIKEEIAEIKMTLKEHGEKLDYA